MKIESVSGNINAAVKLPKVQETEPVVVEEENVTTEETTEQPTQPEEELKGVLRLLAEGHFKGVADLRLRIVHNEELQGVELPELSEPTGNGKAYEKFLAIYNGLNPAPVEEAPTEEAILPIEEIPTEPAEETVENSVFDEQTAEEPVVINLNPENTIFDIPQIIAPIEPVEPLDILI